MTSFRTHDLVTFAIGFGLLVLTWGGCLGLAYEINRIGAGGDLSIEYRLIRDIRHETPAERTERKTRQEEERRNARERHLAMMQYWAGENERLREEIRKASVPPEPYRLREKSPRMQRLLDRAMSHQEHAAVQTAQSSPTADVHPTRRRLLPSDIHYAGP